MDNGSDAGNLSRRAMIGGLAASGASCLPISATAQATSRTTFLSIDRQPDAVTVFEDLDHPLQLRLGASGWTQRGTRLQVHADGRVAFSAAGIAPTHVHVRWNVAVAPQVLFLGDAWERSYGDLQWMSLVPERAMPWYFLTWDGRALHGYGTKTGAAAMCFWQVDRDGVSLWMDVRNGGSAVRLGDRELHVATIVTRKGTTADPPMSSARAFCAKLCDRPRQLPRNLYGSNDWYYAYGKNSANQILRDAELMASVAPAGAESPFTVIDDGWENGAYGDMHSLASGIRRFGVRPGLWIRPLQAPAGTDASLLLPAKRFDSESEGESLPAYDPTNAAALEQILTKVRQAVAFGFDLIKHDYSTFELFGQWGVEMGPQVAISGWSFADRTRTNAEIVRDLYLHIRKAAGERVIIVGCNTIGHLGAGIFESQRSGDDVSGKLWERTRRMGVNTLAFRYPQHRTFFIVDPDCVPITTATPWEMNRQWLDLVSRTGAALFVSPQPQAIGSVQRKALQAAFQTAARAGVDAAPMSWLDTTTPEQWTFGSERQAYRWSGSDGVWPFGV